MVGRDGKKSLPRNPLKISGSAKRLIPQTAGTPIAYDYSAPDVAFEAWGWRERRGVFQEEPIE